MAAQLSPRFYTEDGGIRRLAGAGAADAPPADAADSPPAEAPPSDTPAEKAPKYTGTLGDDIARAMMGEAAGDQADTTHDGAHQAGDDQEAAGDEAPAEPTKSAFDEWLESIPEEQRGASLNEYYTRLSDEQKAELPWVKEGLERQEAAKSDQFAQEQHTQVRRRVDGFKAQIGDGVSLLANVLHAGFESIGAKRVNDGETERLVLSHTDAVADLREWWDGLTDADRAQLDSQEAKAIRATLQATEGERHLVLDNDLLATAIDHISNGKAGLISNERIAAMSSSILTKMEEYGDPLSNAEILDLSKRAQAEQNTLADQFLTVVAERVAAKTRAEVEAEKDKEFAAKLPAETAAIEAKIRSEMGGGVERTPIRNGNAPKRHDTSTMLGTLAARRDGQLTEEQASQRIAEIQAAG